ncbi:cytochrome P450 [Desarmillaria tabescens]|uniref:Cytochrome P450 n=1 Tax=Armillaria tabescens TaxID=1929756 RepID=A0AA39KBH3_ARMTA|nr:cytochrome P450 [Desarmillaria tabescens]KAK0457763.1 cytochrome P450 [Desarmillaria tabescens]
MFSSQTTILPVICSLVYLHRSLTLFRHETHIPQISHYRFKNAEPSVSRVILGAVFVGFFTAVPYYFSSGDSADLYNAIIKLVASILAYCLSLSLSIIAYRHSYIHPLATFPGPKAAVTTKWWMVHRILMKGGRHTKIQELHAEYGPWVRVGPNELSINIPAAVRPIYSQLGRAPFYQGVPAPADSLINVINRKVHARRRQAWNKAVTSDAMRSYIPILETRTSQLLSIFQHISNQKEIINLDHWINLFFIDVMGDMGFSGGFETMAAGKDGDEWIKTLNIGVIFASSMGQVPWLRNLFKYLPRNGPIESFQKFTRAKVDEIKNSKVQRQNILGIIMNESSVSLTADEAAADASLLVVAATDTGVQVVTTLFRYLSVDPGRTCRLQREISSVFVGDDGAYDYQALFALPYLDACIQESLRIIPPGPFGPARTTGPEGAYILGKRIAPNTTVHVPVFTMHRDPAHFGPLANYFIPERWIESENQKNPLLSPCNHDAFMPFSSGYGSCVGKHLALQNIKILVSSIIHKFDIELKSGFDPIQFDKSYKEYGLWTHDALELMFKVRK